MARRRRGGNGRRAAAPAEGLRLWAPWRHVYLRAARDRASKCIFCVGLRLNEAERRRRLILFDGPLAIVMLNRYPYNNGHVMVAPRRHLATPERLTPEERSAIGELVAESVRLLRGVLNPAGFNLGANVGRAAGAGFADHVHWHVVPRWDGDTNFMAVVASTRVLSQHLRDSYGSLRPVFKAVTADLS